MPPAITRNQAQGLSRWGLTLAAGWCLGFVMGRKWLEAAQVKELWDSLATIIGPAGSALGVWWTIQANSKPSILRAAAEMPEVKDAGEKIVITDKAMADKLPENVVAKT